ncbi:DUF4956 domain-containing protein [Eubacterium ruminantium]|uniref:DUF4956 domain-containing protein n=1 Tax=Eubacterium ruminantium TaxID=42322 RepID=UPI001568B657|nr:DUF4956 domain-containing protein [Eubacterium ruminantium]
MSDFLFESIIKNGKISPDSLFLATAVSLVAGLIIAGSYMYKRSYSQSFILSLVLLPCVVQVIIMLVNGNIGAGVAVAGAFSLIRFRSAPGKGQEITSIFLAMATGLATGMGFIYLGLIFAVIISLVGLLLRAVNFGGRSESARFLKIMIPEDLDFEGRFDDIFERYLRKSELVQVKSCDMGTMFKLDYEIIMKSSGSIKEFLDEIREKNGNLEICLTRAVTNMDEL